MSAPSNERPQSESVQRAEIIVEQVGQRLGRFLLVTGQQLRKATARAREEAEDIWAEAQQIRHRDHTEG